MALHCRLIEFDLIILCYAVPVQSVHSSSFSLLFLHLISPYNGNALYLNLPNFMLVRTISPIIKAVFYSDPSFPRSVSFFQFMILCRVYKWVLLADIQKVRTELFVQQGLGKWLRFIMGEKNYIFFSPPICMWTFKQLLVVVFFHSWIIKNIGFFQLCVAVVHYRHLEKKVWVLVS